MAAKAKKAKRRQLRKRPLEEIGFVNNQLCRVSGTVVSGVADHECTWVITRAEKRQAAQAAMSYVEDGMLLAWEPAPPSASHRSTERRKISSAAPSRALGRHPSG